MQSITVINNEKKKIHILQLMKNQVVKATKQVIKILTIHYEKAS